MLRHEAGDEVIHFALPACDRHGDIVGEWKANVKGNQMSVTGLRACGLRRRTAESPVGTRFSSPGELGLLPESFLR